MGEEKPKVIVIAGPTASGKTSLAVELALALNGEIINADSMQVYKGMDIGTAKPTDSERKGIPHHLLDVVAPDEPFNAAIFRSMAIPLIHEITRRGKVPFVVGGTGLYIKTLLGGLFSCPPADLKLREDLNKEWEDKGGEFMYERLKQIDPQTASKIHPHDRIRITRALEVFLLTNKRPSDLAHGHGFRERPFDALQMGLHVEREELYKRINRRSLEMVETGLVQETRRLIEKGYSPELKPMKAIGYRHMVKYIQGQWGLDEAITKLQRDTRRYAKRQLTWFRNDPDFVWVDPGGFRNILEKIREFLLESNQALD